MPNATTLVHITPVKFGKKCSSCHEIKDLTDFHRNRKRTDGRGSYCKPCKSTRYNAANYRAKHGYVRPHVSTKERYRKYRNRPGVAEKMREYCRKSYRKNRYGMTPDDYDNMLKRQGGACGICDTIPPVFHVDHDHVTGKVRGLLCQGCNHGLGMYKDNPQHLRAAADYLEANSCDPGGVVSQGSALRVDSVALC